MSKAMTSPSQLSKTSRAWVTLSGSIENYRLKNIDSTSAGRFCIFPEPLRPSIVVHFKNVKFKSGEGRALFPRSSGITCGGNSKRKYPTRILVVALVVLTAANLPWETNRAIETQPGRHYTSLDEGRMFPQQNQTHAPDAVTQKHQHKWSDGASRFAQTVVMPKERSAGKGQIFAYENEQSSGSEDEFDDRQSAVPNRIQHGGAHWLVVTGTHSRALPNEHRRYSLGNVRFQLHEVPP